MVKQRRGPKEDYNLCDIHVTIGPFRFARHDKVNGKRYADAVEVQFTNIEFETGKG